MNEAPKNESLKPENQIIASGMVLASGEANYANLSADYEASGQVPQYYVGINEFQTVDPSGNVISGIIYTRPINSGLTYQVGWSGDPSPYPLVSGIVNSILAETISRPPVFGSGDYNTNIFSNTGDYEPPSISGFNPYIHYYPKLVDDRTTAYAAAKIPVPFTVDYSFVFQPSKLYNVYLISDYGWDAKDEDDNDIFDNPGGIPPRRYG